MIPCAISGSRSRPRSLVNVIIIVIWIVTITGLVRVIGIIADHHVVSPGHRRTDGDFFLGLIGSAATMRPRARTGTVTVMLAVFVPPHEPLEWRREATGAAGIGRRPGRLLLLLLLLGHRRVRGVLMPHVRITNDGDRSRLHLFLRCAPPPRWLILRALAQNAKNLAVVRPL